MNNNKAQLSAFKRHGIPVSDFVDDKWACELIDVIIDFIYKNATDKKYNYDILGIKLNETFEAFAYTFNKNVAQCKLKDNKNGTINNTTSSPSNQQEGANSNR